MLVMYHLNNFNENNNNNVDNNKKNVSINFFKVAFLLQLKILSYKQ